jgi:hypothetical protein
MSSYLRDLTPSITTVRASNLHINTNDAVVRPSLCWGSRDEQHGSTALRQMGEYTGGKGRTFNYLYRGRDDYCGRDSLY